jgi:hypothetical protein
VKGAHWKLLCQFAEKNDTPDSIKQSFRKLKKERQLQTEDAREKRALAKEAKAAERKEVQKAEASAKDFCRGLAANWPRPRKKAVVRSEAELQKLGGKKEVILLDENRRQTRIIFGVVGDTRFIFTPWPGAWMVALEPTEPKETLEELKRELKKHGRNLWDDARQEPDIAYQAAERLLYCFDWFKGLPSNEGQAAQVQIAIVATVQALKRDAKTRAPRLQVAFDLVTDPQWSGHIGKLLDHALMLACELQRPPTKKELKDQFDSTLPQQHPVHSSEFSKLLKMAGLSWLKRGSFHRGFF